MEDASAHHAAVSLEGGQASSNEAAAQVQPVLSNEAHAAGEAAHGGAPGGAGHGAGGAAAGGVLAAGGEPSQSWGGPAPSNLSHYTAARARQATGSTLTSRGRGLRRDREALSAGDSNTAVCVGGEQEAPVDSDVPARPAGREGADSLLAGGAPAWRGPWLTGPTPGVAPPAAEDEDRMAAIVRRVGPAGAPAGGLQAFQQPNERVLTSAPAQPTPSGGLKRARLGHDDSAEDMQAGAEQGTAWYNTDAAGNSGEAAARPARAQRSGAAGAGESGGALGLDGAGGDQQMTAMDGTAVLTGAHRGVSQRGGASGPSGAAGATVTVPMGPPPVKAVTAAAAMALAAAHAAAAGGAGGDAVTPLPPRHAGQAVPTAHFHPTLPPLSNALPVPAAPADTTSPANAAPTAPEGAAPDDMPTSDGGGGGGDGLPEPRGLGDPSPPPAGPVQQQPAGSREDEAPEVPEEAEVDGGGLPRTGPSGATDHAMELGVFSEEEGEEGVSPELMEGDLGGDVGTDHGRGGAEMLSGGGASAGSPAEATMMR